MRSKINTTSVHYLSVFPKAGEQATLAEREYLPSPDWRLQCRAGFAPQPMERRLSNECGQRSFNQVYSGSISGGPGLAAVGLVTAESQLWSQASRIPWTAGAAKAFNNDGSCESARGGGGGFKVWRDFRQALGVQLPNGYDHRQEREAIAGCYPFEVPRPSLMADNSFDVYASSSTALQSRQVRHRRLMLSEADLAKRLATLTAARRPPLDLHGRIQPPPGYKRRPVLHPPLLPEYVDRSKPDKPPMPLVHPDFVITEDMQPDLFGQLVKRRPPRLWKLSYRSSNEKPGDAPKLASSQPLQPTNDKLSATDCVLAPSTSE